MHFSDIIFLCLRFALLYVDSFFDDKVYYPQNSQWWGVTLGLSRPFCFVRSSPAKDWKS